jgi:regulator of RNase E activity RraA
MSTAAHAKGIQAAIIDGGCRDISEHRELGYPVSLYEVESCE